MTRVLLGVTGSVAAIRTDGLLSALRGAGFAVKLVLTQRAREFLRPDELAPPGPGETVDHPASLARRDQHLYYCDEDEWPAGRQYRLGDPILHVELRSWAQAFVIAPLDASTLSRIAVGICDNLLTSIYRAWQPDKPVILAPAMNTAMWEKRATSRALLALAEEWSAERCVERDAGGVCRWIEGLHIPLRIVAPVEKPLACGDTGMGGLADAASIAACVREVLGGDQR